MPSSEEENIILIKRSNISGVVPRLTSLELGELGLNTHDGKIFLKTETPYSTSIKSFLNSEEIPYVLNESLSSILPLYGNNTVSEVFSVVLGGYNNDITGGGSTVVNGEDNDIHSDFGFIGSGLNNTLSGDYGAILGGKNNQLNHSESFIIGSNLVSHLSGFTYVNNLSSLGKIYGDGSELTGITAGDIEATTLVRTNSAQWNAAYSSTGADLAVRALTANWESTYTTVQTNSANWETAYAYVSANSVNLTATNIFVTNDLTVTDTVSAKYYQGTLIDWMTLVRGTKTTPTLLATIGTGDVYTYVYSTATTDKTYYRYIATDGSEDSFYGNFTNPTLSNLIATKKIIL